MQPTSQSSSRPTKVQNVGSIIFLSYSTQGLFTRKMTFLVHFSKKPSLTPYLRGHNGVMQVFNNNMAYDTVQLQTFPTQGRSTFISFRLGIYTIAKWQLKRPAVVVVGLQLHCVTVNKEWQLFPSLFSLFLWVIFLQESIGDGLEAQKILLFGLFTKSDLSVDN